MTYKALLKAIAELSESLAWAGIMGVMAIAVIMSYGGIMKLKKVANKKRPDVWLYWLVYKNHQLLGSISVAFILFHALWMAYYRVYIKHNNFILFGYIATICMLLSVFSGIITYYLYKGQNSFSIGTKKRWKTVHYWLMISSILFFGMHLLEIYWHDNGIFGL